MTHGELMWAMIVEVRAANRGDENFIPDMSDEELEKLALVFTKYKILGLTEYNINNEYWCRTYPHVKEWAQNRGRKM